MYLTRINRITGLVLIEDDMDGFYAIPEFRKVLELKDGLKIFTCIALVADHLSPIRNYSMDERPSKAMDNVFSNRKAFAWKDDHIQEAAIKYNNLQFNLDIEEANQLQQLRFDKLKEIREADNSDAKVQKTKELEKINELVRRFEQKNEGKDLFSGSPVKNGYTLTRLEQLVDNKKSFYHHETAKKDEPVEN